jgi:hypothetical protein
MTIHISIVGLKRKLEIFPLKVSERLEIPFTLYMVREISFETRLLGDASRQSLHGKWISCIQYLLISSSLDHCHQLCPDMKMEHMMELIVVVKFSVKLQKLPSEH